MLPQAHASLTILLGGVLGGEREFRDRAAGFRPLILISIGACIFTQYSLHIGNPQDPTHTAAEKVAHLDSAFVQCGLRVRSRRHTKTGDHLVCTWVASGSLKKHEALVKAPFDNPDVRGFRY